MGRSTGGWPLNNRVRSTRFTFDGRSGRLTPSSLVPAATSAPPTQSMPSSLVSGATRRNATATGSGRQYVMTRAVLAARCLPPSASATASSDSVSAGSDGGAGDAGGPPDAGDVDSAATSTAARGALDASKG